MKIHFLAVIALTFSSFAAAAVDEAALNTHLDERIELNIEYRHNYVEEAKDFDRAALLEPIEAELGDAWVAYLKFVRASKDNKLKSQVVRLELLDEIRGCIYDLEYSESKAETTKILKQLKAWKRKLAEVDAAIAG